jgi:hypothetical protein
VDTSLDQVSDDLNKFKDKFINEDGISNLINVIEAAYEEGEYATYFYCLSMIAPMVHNADFLSKNAKKKKSQWVKSYDDIVDEFNSKQFIKVLIK